MISKKTVYTLDGHLIEFCLVFNPLRMGSYERLSVDGKVVAESACSRSRKQCVLKVDAVIDGTTRQIMAISAPMKSGMKQGIQIRIDNQFACGDADLDIAGDEDECAFLNGTTQTKKSGKGVSTVLKAYVTLLIIFTLFMIRQNGFDSLKAMSADEFLFFLGVPAVISAMYFAALGIVKRLFS